MPHIVVIGLEHNLGMLISLGHVNNLLEVVWREFPLPIRSDVYFSDRVSVVVCGRECLLFRFTGATLVGFRGGGCLWGLG